MKNLKIAHKLGLLILFALAGFMGIGLIYVYGLKIQEEALIQQQRIAKITELVNKIHNGTLNARRREKEFLLHRKMVDADEHANTCLLYTSRCV